MMPTLSLCMIVRNEEKHLARCLTSVKDVVDEIVIVDTGSEDKTVSIAESFNASIFHFKWNNDFSSARNFSLSKCQSDWILYLDADEELNFNSVKELNAILNGKLVAVNCIVKSLTANDSKFGVMKYPRLFPNDKRIKFEGKVHEQIQTSLDNNKIPLIESSIEIIHYGYILDEESANKKLERNLALLQSSKKYNPYKSLKLAQTLYGLNKYDEAAQNFKRVINDNSTDVKIKSSALLHYAILLYEQNDLKKSLDAVLKGLSINAKSSYLNYLASVIHLRINDKQKAFEYLLTAVDSNLKLLNGNEVIESEIISDQIDLYLRAINLAVYLGEEEKLFNLIKELSNFIEYKSTLKAKILEKNLLSFVNESELSDEKLNQIISIVSESSITSFVELLKTFKSVEIINRVLVLLNERFSNSHIVKKNLAGIYLKTNPAEAEKLFLECNKIEEDSTIYINLISLYIGKKDYDKVRSTFKQLQSRFSDKPIIKQKIEILGQKLSPLLKSN